MSIILVDTEGLCFCNCACKCILGKCGSEGRCTKEQIEKLGYHTLQVDSKRSEREVRKAMCIDGEEHKLKVRDIKS
jgi:hypothetical protein